MTANVQNTGTQIRFRDSTDFSPTAANNYTVGTPTDVQLDLTSLSASGGARESTKVDLGTPRPILYKVTAVLEHAATPTDGDTVSFYWAASPSGTAGTANLGNITGTDAAYVDSAGSLAQLQYIGDAVLRAATLNECHVGFLLPSMRYGNLVVVNNDGTAMFTDMVETHIVFDPVVYGDA